MHATKLHRTRFDILGYQQIDHDCWRVMDLSDGRPSVVGPQYRTKAELLGDLTRYAREVWSLE